MTVDSAIPGLGTEMSKKHYSCSEIQLSSKTRKIMQKVAMNHWQNEGLRRAERARIFRAEPL